MGNEELIGLKLAKHLLESVHVGGKLGTFPFGDPLVIV